MTHLLELQSPAAVEKDERKSSDSSQKSVPQSLLPSVTVAPAELTVGLDVAETTGEGVGAATGEGVVATFTVPLLDAVEPVSTKTKKQTSAATQTTTPTSTPQMTRRRPKSPASAPWRDRASAIAARPSAAAWPSSILRIVCSPRIVLCQSRCPPFGRPPLSVVP